MKEVTYQPKEDQAAHLTVAGVEYQADVPKVVSESAAEALKDAEDYSFSVKAAPKGAKTADSEEG